MLKSVYQRLASASPVTHVLAVILAGAVSFAMSPAGHALVAQYPVLSGVVTMLMLLASLYHLPIPPAPVSVKKVKK